MTRFPLPDGVTYPWGIVSGPDGNLWFTYDNGIGRISP
jgi:streptogramin lyase